MADETLVPGVYGAPPRALADVPADAVQLSPLRPGSRSLEDLRLASLVMLAPGAAVERRRVLALALRALAPGAPFTVMAPKDKGGARLKKELEAFGCAVADSPKRHHRICVTVRPDAPQGLDAALTEGAPRYVPALDAWSQPGLFSADRLDPGTALLLDTLPPLKGKGADFGCGLGLLARAILVEPAVESLDLIDIDRRAVALARRNVPYPRARFHWADLTTGAPPLGDLDFVVMNPPFHDAGDEDKGLGQRFITRAAAVLKKGGVLWMVANRHLPYEKVLADSFTQVRPAEEANGFKVFEAIR